MHFNLRNPFETFSSTIVKRGPKTRSVENYALSQVLHEIYILETGNILQSTWTHLERPESLVCLGLKANQLPSFHILYYSSPILKRSAFQAISSLMVETNPYGIQLAYALHRFFSVDTGEWSTPSTLQTHSSPPVSNKLTNQDSHQNR